MTTHNLSDKIMFYKQLYCHSITMTIAFKRKIITRLILKYKIYGAKKFGLKMITFDTQHLYINN